MKLKQQTNNIFNKPSILINLAHSLDISLNSLKVFNFVIRKLFKNEDIENKTIINTSYAELAEFLGYEKYDKKLIFSYLEELFNTQINTMTFNYKRNDWRDCMITHMLGTIIYNLEEEDLSLEITQGLRDWVLRHQATFAKLDMEELKLIKSRHSLKLYELFKDYSYHRNHKMSVNIEDLYKFLNVEDNSIYRNNIKLFNQKIIKKALEEINSKTFMTVNFKYNRVNKQNKKASITFEIQDIERYSFNHFKATFIEYYKYKNFVIKFEKKEYTLCEVEAKNSKNINTNYMLVDNKNYKTVETEKASEIWEYVYREICYNTLNFCELIGIDFNDFNEMYEVIKNRANKTIKNDIKDKNEIILHPNQGVLDL